MLRDIIYIVDDDDGICATLKGLLSRLPASIETFDDPARFVGAVDAQRCGCVLLDLYMPGMSGLEVLEHLNRLEPRPTVIMMSGAGDIPTAVTAIRTGAYDFITKPVSPPELLARVASALQANAEKRDHYARFASLRERYGLLTPREREVLFGLIVGHRNKVIAYEMGVSVRTVEIHRANIMHKLEVDSVSSLVLLAAVLRTEDPELDRYILEASGGITEHEEGLDVLHR